MLPETKQDTTRWMEVRKEQLREMATPVFSADFLHWISTRLSNEISKILRKDSDEETRLKAVRMLEDLEMLWIYRINILEEGGKLSGLDRDDLQDIVGRTTYLLDWSSLIESAFLSGSSAMPIP